MLSLAKTPTPSPQAGGPGHAPSRLARSERKRLAVALLLSLAIHALLSGLTFGGHEPGLPGFGLPWRDRRIEAPELRVVIVPTPVTAAGPAAPRAAAPLQPATEQTVAAGPVLTLSAPAAPPARPAADTIVPDAEPVPRAMPKANVDATVAKSPSSTVRPSGTAGAPTMPVPPLVALDQAADPTLDVAPAAPAPTAVVAPAPSASSPQSVLPAPRDAGDESQERIELEARQRAVELGERDRLQREAQSRAQQLQAQQAEAARLEDERHEAARQDAARQAAASQEAARAEAVRLEVERQEAAKQAAARQETARQAAASQAAARAEAARLEVERQEAARQSTARQETARQAAASQAAARAEAARLEAERHEAARQEAAQAAARPPAAQVQAAQEEAEAARREAARRAIGRQLDEEAARREAASNATRPPGTLASSWSSARRGRLFGRTDPNTDLVLYAEAWARKIQLNAPLDVVRETAKRARIDPVVTVAIRRDGSVESVVFVVSSGTAEIDDAIRRIVQSQAPYPAFSPGLASHFDVIEIRRTWYFDMAVRLY